MCWLRACRATASGSEPFVELPSEISTIAAGGAIPAAGNPAASPAKPTARQGLRGVTVAGTVKDYRPVTDAQKELHRKKIKGPATTPFLLDAITRLTGGSSLEANVALLEANARLAGEIAVVDRHGHASLWSRRRHDQHQDRQPERGHRHVAPPARAARCDRRHQRRSDECRGGVGPSSLVPNVGDDQHRDRDQGDQHERGREAHGVPGGWPASLTSVVYELAPRRTVIGT